jgi:hypothetical protein
MTSAHSGMSSLVQPHFAVPCLELLDDNLIGLLLALLAGGLLPVSTGSCCSGICG